jgi:hypothetical protein
MKQRHLVSTVLLLGTSLASAAPVTPQLLRDYQAQGAGPFSATAGQAAWEQVHQDPKGGQARSCTTCHGRDLRLPGKHVRTGKVIKPLAPSRNGARLTDRAKVEKWLKRNCKWVLGRECSAQEKGDYLSYIQSQ